MVKFRESDVSKRMKEIRYEGIFFMKLKCATQMMSIALCWKFDGMRSSRIRTLNKTIGIPTILGNSPSCPLSQKA